MEPLGRDAEDGELLTVHDDGLAEHIPIAAQLGLPVRVREHGDEVGADALVVGFREEAAQGRPHTEGREIRTGDVHAVSGKGLVVVDDAHPEAVVGGDPREHRLPLFEVPEHPVAEDHITVPGLAARLRARLGAGVAQVDQLVGLPHGQGPEQDLVEERKDGRVGPDAEGQREDGDGGDERSPKEGPECQPDTSHRRRLGVLRL